MSQPDGETPSRTSRLGFSVVVVLLLAAAIRHSCVQYGIYIDLTLHRSGNVWPTGQPVGADFIQFAAVSEAWKRGRIDEIYASPERQIEFITLAAELDRRYDGVLQFNYPPFVTWLLRPLAPLDYMQRFVGWTLLQIAFAVAALAFWRQELRPGVFALVAVAFIFSPPVLSNLVLGQTAFIGLAALSGTLYFLNRGRDFTAGVVLSLVFYKPVFGLVLGPLLLVARRWRVVLGVAVGALILATASVAVSLKACEEYPIIVRNLVDLALGAPAFYSGQFNLLGFVATLLGKTPEEFNWARIAVVAAPIAALVVLTGKAWCIPWRPGTPHWSAGASAALLTTFIGSPYLFAYDTMLAAIAAVYSIRTWDVRPTWHRWFILGCISVAWFFLARHHQLGVTAIAAWAVLDARWAIAQARLEESASRPREPAADRMKEST